MLALADLQLAADAVARVERQPWIAVVIVLVAICATLVAGLWWAARKLLPWIETRQSAAHDHVERVLAARGAEAGREVAEVAAKLGERLADVEETVTEVRLELGKVAAKLGAGLVLLVLIGSVLAACWSAVSGRVP